MKFRSGSQVLAEGGYEPRVFFVRGLGFVEPTAARRITYEDSLAFERVHEQVYRELGFQLTEVPPGPLADRAALIQQSVIRHRGGLRGVSAVRNPRHKSLT